MCAGGTPVAGPEPVAWPILVVGDDASACATLVEVLAARGYRPVGATGAHAAADLILRDGLRPAVIVVDTLFARDAVRLVGDPRIAPLIARVPTVLISAEPWTWTAGALPEPVLSVLPRPYDLQHLLPLVARLCGAVRTGRPPGVPTTEASHRARTSL